jgi:hypothetical protein
MIFLFDPLEKAGSTTLTIFIGYDPKEDLCAKILAHTIRKYSNHRKDFVIIPLIYNQLYANEYTSRKLDKRGSTEFSMTRFLSVPITRLHMPYPESIENKHKDLLERYALFLDCDMMFTESVWNLLESADLSKPVSVCKHDYSSSSRYKMHGTPQENYPRKNWSSVTLWNCLHDKTKQMTFKLADTKDPAYLHRFQGFDDNDIGELPLKWNYLVDEPMDRDYYGLEKDELPSNIHHTLGSPVFRLYQDSEYSDLWKENFKSVFSRDFDVTKDTI